MKSTAAAETLAAGISIDKEKIMKINLSGFLIVSVPLDIAGNNKNLFTSLTNYPTSIHCFIRANVIVVRFEFEVRNVNAVTWLPGAANPSNSLRKAESQLTGKLKLTLFNGYFSSVL